MSDHLRGGALDVAPRDPRGRFLSDPRKTRGARWGRAALRRDAPPLSESLGADVPCARCPGRAAPAVALTARGPACARCLGAA